MQPLFATVTYAYVFVNLDPICDSQYSYMRTGPSHSYMFLVEIQRCTTCGLNCRYVHIFEERNEHQSCLVLTMRSGFSII